MGMSCPQGHDHAEVAMMEWSGLSKQAFVTVQRGFRDEAALVQAR
jgi:hypothetical protein